MLWVGHPKGFGFASDLHVGHWQGGEGFTVRVRWNGQPVEAQGGRVLASRMELTASAPGLEVTEAKLLTADDVLVSVLGFRASAPGTVAVETSSGLCREALPGGGLAGRETFHGLDYDLALRGAGTTGDKVLSWQRKLQPGQSAEARFALAFARGGDSGGDSGAGLAAASAAAGRELAAADPVAREAARVERWFDEEAPGFDAPDPWFRAAFVYRLMVAKKSILDARGGNLPYPAALEGRWAQPWYPAAITFGAGHQLAELRWLADKGIAWGHVLNFVRNQRPDGAFIGARTDQLLTEYSDFTAWGARELALVTGDWGPQPSQVAGALACSVEHALSSEHDRDGDALPEPRDHWESGMEWQPSFFAFSGYDPSNETRLERVEYACFLHGNAVAAADALAACGREGEAARYRQVAADVAQAVEARMWVPDAGFYLALRASDHKPAPDREAPGFYPPGFGITPADELGYLAQIRDPASWATEYPPPSVELSSPAFSATQKWPAGMGGGSACMWNGPTWPHALTFVLRSLAVGERAGRLQRGETFAVLEQYTRAHFWGLHRQRYRDKPIVGEMIQPFNGAWLSSERDYFHSTYVDLVITLLVGLVPSWGDELVLRPLLPPGKWDRFALTRVRYHGRRVDVVWDEPGGEDAYGDGRDGLEVWVDGRLAARRADLGELRAGLGPGL